MSCFKGMKWLQEKISCKCTLSQGIIIMFPYRWLLRLYNIKAYYVIPICSKAITIINMHTQLITIPTYVTTMSSHVNTIPSQVITIHSHVNIIPFYVNTM